MKKMRLDLQFFASGSFELNKGTGNANWKSLQGKIVWSSVSNGSEANTSTVTTQLWVRTWTGGTSERNWPGSVKVGSNTAHTFSDMGADWADKWIGDTYVLFKTYTDIVKHNDDGTCKVNISASITGPNGTSLAGVTSSGSKEVTLDTIPRATSLDSFSGSKRIGVANDVIINFTKKATRFTTTLAYATKEDLSDLTTIVDKSTNASTYSWTLPINLLNKIPNSKTLKIYIRLTTYDGNIQIGNAQTSSFDSIVYEDNCRPVWNTHTIEETDATAKQLVTTANKFIANLSKPKFTFSATGQYGATISYYQINNTTRTSGFTDSAFNTNGYTIKVVDSRGVTNTYTFTTTYVPYFTPIFEEVKLFRDTPTSNKVFSYFKIKFFNNTSSVKFDNPQALSYKFNYQEAGGTAQEILITPETYDIETSRYAENETELGSSFNYKKSVDWTFFFADLTGKTFKTNNTLPMGIPLMNGKMNEYGEQELYVNGKTIVGANIESKNLFNDKKIKLTSNSSITYTDDSFTISSNGYWGYGEYFTTLPAGTYTLSGDVSGNVDFIELYINGKWINGVQPFTLNLDTESEIRIVFYATTGEHSSGSTTFSKVQLEKGTTVTDFVSYLNLKETILKDTEARVSNVVSRNLFNINKINPTFNYETKLTKIENGIRATALGTGQSRYSAVELDKSLLGKTVTLSANMKASSTNQSTLSIYFGTTSEPYLSGIYWFTESGSHTFTIPSTFPSGCDKLFLNIYSNGGGTGVNGAYVDYTNIQIEEGSATPYVPYLNLEEAMPKLKVINVGKSNYVKQGYISAIQFGNIVVVEVSELFLTEDRNEWDTFIGWGLPKPYLPGGGWAKGVMVDNRGIGMVGSDGNLYISQRTNVQLANVEYNCQIVYITLD